MEEWKDIKGFEGRYQVSNTGKVRNAKSGNLLSLNRLTKCGYRKAALYLENRKSKECRIHRLVAETFISNPDNKETVNHKDGDKLNNHVNNLEWATRSEQVFHSYELGLKNPLSGTSSPHSKLTDDQVREIRSLYIPQSKEFGAVALSKKYNVSHRVILLVAKGKSYKHVK